MASLFRVSECFMNPVLVQQKRLSEQLLLNDSFSPSEPLFLKLGLLKLDDISTLQLTSFVYPCVNKLALHCLIIISITFLIFMMIVKHHLLYSYDGFFRPTIVFLGGRLSLKFRRRQFRREEREKSFILQTSGKAKIGAKTKTLFKVLKAF